MRPVWQRKLKSELGTGGLVCDGSSRKKLSRDQHHFSPLLKEELDGEIADCVVRPKSEGELDAVLSIAATHLVPVTVRGAGTGCSGQSVPMAGGILIDTSHLARIHTIENDVIWAGAGARLIRTEAAARRENRELQAYPPSFHTATMGGFVSGGFAGMGAQVWGWMWDGHVSGLTVKTLEQSPRTFTVTGDEIDSYLHSYGTVGIITEVGVSLVPRREWSQWAVSFGTFEDAYAFGVSIATDSAIRTRLLSIHEWPIASFFNPLTIPAGNSLVLLELDLDCEREVAEWVREWGGIVARRVPAHRYLRGGSLSDFAWHNTMHFARRENKDMTYLQVRFSVEDGLTQMEAIKRVFPECMMHVEMMRSRGTLVAAGLPLFRFSTEERLTHLMRYCESIGVSVANPHTYQLYPVGGASEMMKLVELKRKTDPYGLLNPNKLRATGRSDRAV